MTEPGRHTTKRWGRAGLLATLVAFAMVIAALPGVASAGSANAAYLTSPLGKTLTSPTQTFTWSPGVGATNYWLYVGTYTGASNIYNSGATTALTKTATNMPADGSTLHVRLWSLVNGAWQYNDYEFAAAQPVLADLTFPLQHQILPGTNVDFQWNAVSGVQGFWLYAGSSVGSSNECNSGLIAPSATDFDCTSLPTDASTVYVRLWTNVGTPSVPNWLYHDYAFTASGAIVPILSPSILGLLSGATCSVGLPISALVDIGPSNATSISLTAGTTGPGSVNLLANISVLPLDLNVALGLPTCPAVVGDSITIYARLYYQFGAILYHDDYTFTLTAVL